MQTVVEFEAYFAVFWSLQV